MIPSTIESWPQTDSSARDVALCLVWRWWKTQLVQPLKCIVLCHFQAQLAIRRKLGVGIPLQCKVCDAAVECFVVSWWNLTRWTNFGCNRVLLLHLFTLEECFMSNQDWHHNNIVRPINPLYIMPSRTRYHNFFVHRYVLGSAKHWAGCIQCHSASARLHRRCGFSWRGCGPAGGSPKTASAWWCAWRCIYEHWDVVDDQPAQTNGCVIKIGKKGDVLE